MDIIITIVFLVIVSKLLYNVDKGSGTDRNPGSVKPSERAICRRFFFITKTK